MKKFFISLLFIAVSSTILAEESRSISAIRGYYNETMKKIKNGTLYQRDLHIAYPIIPGVGPTSSKVRIYYDMPEGRDGDYDYLVIRVENYYQHSGRTFYEEFLFQPDGTLSFYYGRSGTGDIMSEDIDWTYDERFYFDKGKLARVMYDSQISDRPSAADIKKAGVRTLHAKQVYSKYSHKRYPPPVVSFPEK